MAELRVLVADDDANMLDLMSRRLGRMGLQVDRAEDGRTVSALIERSNYDLVVTDLYMPGATGLDILRRAKERDPHVQVLVVTGSATLHNAVEALNMGAFSYLTKPFDHLSVFDNAVSRALEFRHLVLDNLRRRKSSAGAATCWKTRSRTACACCELGSRSCRTCGPVSRMGSSSWRKAGSDGGWTPLDSVDPWMVSDNGEVYSGQGPSRSLPTRSDRTSA